MDSEDKEKKGFAVIDKRASFKGSKDDSAKEQAESKISPNASEQAGGSSIHLEGEEKASGGMPPINFSSFIISLATQALIQMGEMPSPAGVSIDVNLEAARQTIEIIGMLEEKTRGNLEKNEEQLLTEMLDNLRLTYAKKVA